MNGRAAEDAALGEGKGTRRGGGGGETTGFFEAELLVRRLWDQGKLFQAGG